MTGIYAIENIASGGLYIGSSNDITTRWYRHKSLLKHGGHHCEPLQRSYVKRGAEAFRYIVLEQCAEGELLPREQAWLDLARSGGLLYNVALAAGAPTRGRVGIGKGRTVSLEARAKISAANTGRKLSEETRARMSASRRGKPLGSPSEETRRKMSAAAKGRKVSAETRLKLSLRPQCQKGHHPVSAETRRKMSIAAKNRKK